MEYTELTTSQIAEELTNYGSSQIQYVIDEYIHSERDRNILKRRLCDEIHYEPLAEEFGLSVKQVKNIVYKRMRVIFKYLRKLY